MLTTKGETQVKNEKSGVPQTSEVPRTSEVTLINTLTKSELASVLTAHKCISLQDFARDKRNVRVDTIAINQYLTEQAGEDVYKIEKLNGVLVMVTGHSLMLEISTNKHRVIALDKVLDLILS